MTDITFKFGDGHNYFFTLYDCNIEPGDNPAAICSDMLDCIRRAKPDFPGIATVTTKVDGYVVKKEIVISATPGQVNGLEEIKHTLHNLNSTP